QRGHVHTDLVGTPGLQVDLQQAGGTERLLGVVVGHRVATTGDHGPSAVTGGMAADGGVHRAAQRVRMTLDERVVTLVHGTFLERPFEHAVGDLALGHDHQPAGVGVEPVHDPLPFGGPAHGQLYP